MGLIRIIIKKIIRSSKKGKIKITEDREINGDITGNIVLSNGATLVVNGDVIGNITGGKVKINGDHIGNVV